MTIARKEAVIRRIFNKFLDEFQLALDEGLLDPVPQSESRALSRNLLFRNLLKIRLITASFLAIVISSRSKSV